MAASKLRQFRCSWKGCARLRLEPMSQRPMRLKVSRPRRSKYARGRSMYNEPYHIPSSGKQLPFSFATQIYNIIQGDLCLQVTFARRSCPEPQAPSCNTNILSPMLRAPAPTRIRQRWTNSCLWAPPRVWRPALQ